MYCRTPGFPVLHYFQVCSSSCPLSRWCYLTVSSSAAPFLCLPSFPASGSFLLSQFFASGGQSIEASALASVLPKNIWGWLPLGLTGLISLFQLAIVQSIADLSLGTQGKQFVFHLNAYGFGNASHRKINYNNEKILSLEKFSLFHDFFRDQYTGGLSELHFWETAEYKVLFWVLEEYRDEWDIVTFLKELRDQ